MPRARPLKRRSGQGRSREPSRKGACVKPCEITFHDRHATSRPAVMEAFSWAIKERTLIHMITGKVVQEGSEFRHGRQMRCGRPFASL
jgi:hypothetical protein